MKGLALVLRLTLRFGAIAILGIPVVLNLLVLATANQIADVYDTQVARDAYAMAVGSFTGSRALTGRGHDLGTLGGIMANEMATFVLTLFPLAAAMLAIHLTRTQEDRGRTEILTAGRVGRLVPTVAGTIATFTMVVLAGALTFGILVALDYDTAGSARYALAVVAIMALFGALGLLAAQLHRRASGAVTMSAVAVFGLFMLRAVIDVREWDLVWTSPSSWFAELRPFGPDVVWWAWGSFAVTTLVLLVAAFVVAGGRDLGAGVIPTPTGRATLPGWARGPSGIFTRLVGRSIIGWLIAAGAFALAIGLLSKDLAEALAATPGASSGSIDQMISQLVVYNACLAAACGVQCVQWLAGHELSGRLGYLLSTRLGRLRWWFSTTALVLVWALLVLAVAGVCTGIGLTISLDDRDQFAAGLRATLQLAPAVVAIIALGFLLVSLWARLAPLTWLPLVWALVVVLRADTLDMSELARRLSLPELLGHVPMDEWDTTAALLMTGMAVAGWLLSGLIFRRRNLPAG